MTQKEDYLFSDEGVRPIQDRRSAVKSRAIAEIDSLRKGSEYINLFHDYSELEELEGVRDALYGIHYERFWSICISPPIDYKDGEAVCRGRDRDMLLLKDAVKCVASIRKHDSTLPPLRVNYSKAVHVGFDLLLDWIRVARVLKKVNEERGESDNFNFNAVSAAESENKTKKKKRDKGVLDQHVNEAFTKCGRACAAKIVAAYINAIHPDFTVVTVKNLCGNEVWRDAEKDRRNNRKSQK